MIAQVVVNPTTIRSTPRRPLVQFYKYITIKYQTVGTFLKPNRKNVETEAKWIFRTHIYLIAHFPSLVHALQCGGVKLDFIAQTSSLTE